MARFLLMLVLSTWAHAADRIVESVLPSLDYGPACWSAVNLQNLGDRNVTVEVEAHRESGALVALVGLSQVTIHLSSGEHASYRLEIPEETGSGWMRIRERIPNPQLSPVIAVAGTSECVAANQLRTTARQAAYPTRNPWFSGDSDEMPGNLISLVNTTEKAAKASLCYSSGNLYSVPGTARLTPICSSSMDVQIPAFGARRFPVEREGSSHFSIKSQGEGIALQMLRPLETGLKVYSVDSTIKFGEEVSKVP
jgi:hypothetical protein